MCDVALDPYTTHGHDGILEKKEILNDKTIEILIKQSLLQAQMGCDVIAPSDTKTFNYFHTQLSIHLHFMDPLETP